MSIGILTLKIGLVTTVTGASIATPILLNRNSGVSSSVTPLGPETERKEEQITSQESSDPPSQEVKNSEASDDDSRGLGSVGSSPREDSSALKSLGSDKQQRGSQTTDSSDQVSPTTVASESTESLSRSEGGVDLEREGEGQDVQKERDLQGSRVSEDTLRTSSSLISEASHPSTIKVEDFDKKCFVVPAKSSEDGVELLTCFDAKEAENEDNEGEAPEYSSIFHLFNPNKKNVPVEIQGELLWKPDASQISVQVLKDISKEENEYTFRSEKSGWDRVSGGKQIDLLGQCAIYKVTLKGSDYDGTYWLSCGDDNGDVFNSENPTSIPLTDWRRKSQ